MIIEMFKIYKNILLFVYALNRINPYLFKQSISQLVNAMLKT